MQACTILLGIALATAAPATAETIKLPNCLVSLIEEVQVPSEEAGVLVELAVREGQQVKVGDPLGRVDETHAQMQYKVAQFDLQVAKEEASNDIHVRYAAASAKVSEAEYLQAKEANERVSGAVSQAEMRRLKLKWRETLLSIEQAQTRLRVNALKARVSEAEVEAAAENVRRRRMTSPLDGVVVTLHRHAGEWVQPGDKVMHIVRVDRLRVEGFLNAGNISPGEVAGQPVTVRVTLARGRKESFAGKVVFVNPLVQAGGNYSVWAEVVNRQEKGQWLLRDGLKAEMTIQLK